jgi:hypothetical protein
MTLVTIFNNKAGNARDMIFAFTLREKEVAVKDLL